MLLASTLKHTAFLNSVYFMFTWFLEF